MELKKLEELKEIAKQIKIDFVKAQDFETASIARDLEKRMLKKIEEYDK